jgi:Mechanosensitive ion channel, conserved TM helix
MVGLLAISFEQGLEEAWNHIAVFVPKFVAFLLILVIGYFVAKAIEKILNGVLERVGFDRWVERGGLRKALERSKYDPSDILAKLVFWAAFLFVLQLAFGVFGPNPISDLIAGIIAYLPNIFVAIVILVIAGALARAATDLLQNVLSGVSGGEWMARGAGIAILVIGFFAALNQLRIAPAIVNGLYYAILAIIVGSAIVAIGGGGIRTMQRYWERSATRLESKGAEVGQAVQAQRRVPGTVRSEVRTEMGGERSGTRGMPEDLPPP